MRTQADGVLVHHECRITIASRRQMGSCRSGAKLLLRRLGQQPSGLLDRDPEVSPLSRSVDPKTTNLQGSIMEITETGMTFQLSENAKLFIKLMNHKSIRLVLGFWFIASLFVFGNIPAVKAEDALTVEGVWQVISITPQNSFTKDVLNNKVIAGQIS